MKTTSIVTAVILSLMSTVLLSGTGFRSGERVLALWRANGFYYVGSVVKCENGLAGKTCFVVFADGDSDNLPVNLIRPMSLKAGSSVFALWKDKKMYPGKIARIVGQALYIHFDDGDKGWTSWAGIALNEVRGKYSPPPPPPFLKR